MTTVFYSDDYVASRHEFDTTRKAKHVADSLVLDPVPGVVLREPVPLMLSEVESCHDAAYAAAVLTGVPRDLAESNGFEWDEGIWRMVTSSNGGAVEAAELALETGRNTGSLSSGLHHARSGRGSGFCTFNGLAIAAKRLALKGAKVLVLDLDAHCGGGTWDILKDAVGISCVDIATSPFDEYRNRIRRDWTLDIVGGESYLPTLLLRLSEIDDIPDVVIYNAGMDPFTGSGIGGGLSAHQLARREEMVFEWARSEDVPVAFVLAGGYIGRGNPMSNLVGLHRMTVREASRG